MSADQEVLMNDTRALEFRCDGRHAAQADSPRHSLSDVYCHQCWMAGDSASPAVNGIDYFRYWDCCGVPTIAIESKIEQALDLVKNHLMFAVREEIRALNDEIHELLSKNEQLESENRFLRSYASQETLSRLHHILSQLTDRHTFAPA